MTDHEFADLAKRAGITGWYLTHWWPNQRPWWNTYTDAHPCEICGVAVHWDGFRWSSCWCDR